MPGRIIGVDMARALAILGMFAAHLGPEPQVGGVVGAAMYVSHGRASILFATLAGLRLRPSTNFVIAAMLAVLTPVVLLMLLGSTGVAGVFEAIERFDPIALAGGEGLIELLLTGTYPVLTWTPFLIAGVALGRLDWQRPRVRIVVAAAGTAVAVLAYGLAWVLGKTVDGAGDWFDEPARRTANYWADLPWASLLNAEEHTGTPFEIIGGVGVAVVVLSGCVWFAARLRQRGSAVGCNGLDVTHHVCRPRHRHQCAPHVCWREERI
jgi:hypothetical protein